MKTRIFALMLALLAAVSCTASAETTKHERVYVVANADGTPETLIDSVRLENPEAAEILLDATQLDNVENVGGQEVFTKEGETLSWQASGKSIIYQGGSEKAPYVTPVVSLTLNGEPATPEDVANGEGELVIEVSFETTVDAPFLAVSLLPLSDDSLTDIAVDNGAVLSGGTQKVLLGWAVPGLDERAKLPDRFTMTAHADHADLSWMMTAATAKPIEILCSRIEDDVLDAQTLADSLTDGLIALRDEAPIPGDDDIAEALREMSALFDGANALCEATAALADGAAAADKGVSALETGLSTLTANNEMLNQGASQLFASVLDAANAQLSASGLDAAGITLPALTAENYASVLDAVMEQLTAVPAEAAQAQSEESMLLAREAFESLSALKAQLDSVNAFVTGLSAYTSAVSDAAAGAMRLHSGTTALLDGAAQLKTGVSELSQGLDSAKTEMIGKALSLLEGDLRQTLDVFDSTRAQVSGALSYDLVREGMEHDLVFIIRTDLTE